LAFRIFLAVSFSASLYLLISCVPVGQLKKYEKGEEKKGKNVQEKEERGKKEGERKKENEK
jgi:hypothetical protein